MLYSWLLFRKFNHGGWYDIDNVQIQFSNSSYSIENSVIRLTNSSYSEQIYGISARDEDDEINGDTIETELLNNIRKKKKNRRRNRKNKKNNNSNRNKRDTEDGDPMENDELIIDEDDLFDGDDSNEYQKVFDVRWPDLKKHLYNVVEDPEEKNDLKRTHRDIMEQLRQRVREYYGSFVERDYPAEVKRGKPKHFGNVWSSGWC